MAIPTGYIHRVKTHKPARLDDHVFQNLIYGMTNMNITVGIWRAIMQDELWLIGMGGTNLFVELILLPASYPLRLTLS